MLFHPKLAKWLTQALEQTLFDIKFWPWPDQDEEPVFAVTGGRHVSAVRRCAKTLSRLTFWQIVVCRTKHGSSPPYEILRWWREDESYELNSICWTKDTEGRPLLCAAGSSPKSITIYDVEAGRPLRTLSGHGRAINDLQLSPLSPSILASASEDYSVRLWNLSPKYEKQPCVAILVGQSHKQPLLTLDFHPNGRWLLSGSMDTAIALWGIPPLAELDDPATVDQEPRNIAYPYFMSEEIHANYVDSVKWYGDLILSRAARGQTESDKKHNDLILWKIDGFDGSLPPPEHPPIPYPGRFTRTSFPHSERSRGFEYILTFAIHHTPRFYLRFGLFHEPAKRPVLVIGNEESKFLFWDLQRCEEGEDGNEMIKPGRGGKGSRGGRGKKSSINTESLSRLNGLRRDASVASDSTRTSALPSASNSNTPASASASQPVAPGEKRLVTDDPMRPIRPHWEKIATTGLSARKHFATSQVQWSPDGRWMVGVGDHGMIAVFHREHVA